MQPSEEDFSEWRQHPVSEWVFSQMSRFAEKQKQIWADHVWDKQEIDPLFLSEAKTNAAAYQAIPQRSYEDWKALDDTESE